MCKKFDIRNIVVHPDTVVDWEVFLQYADLPISIENMDDQKNFWKTIEDIASILEKYDFGLTLDVQHCFTNDPSMQLAKDFHEKFSDRIVEYHLSGYDPEKLHYTLFKTEQDIIIDHVLLKDKPIILESCMENYDEGKMELEYVLERLGYRFT